MGKVDGRVAFVTGAGHGQGRSHAVRLAEEGADIVAVDVCRPEKHLSYPMATPEELEETATLVEETGRRCTFAQIDVRNGTELRGFVDEAVGILGPVAIICANAAINIMRPFDQLTEEIWSQVIDTNLTGVFNTIKAGLPSMIEAGLGGAIVITSSSAAISGLPFHAHYAAAKAGLVGFTKSLAVELGDKNIRINTLHPAAVNTAMSTDTNLPALLADEHNLNMFQGSYQPVLPTAAAEVDDITNAVLFLASDDSRLITGTSLALDSGVSCH